MTQPRDFHASAKELRDVLQRTVPMMEPMSDAEASQPYAPGKWTRKQVISHLVDSASNNHQRFTRAAFAGQYKGDGYQQDKLIALQDPNALEWKTLVQLWSSYNAFLAHVIDRLPASVAEAPCEIGGDIAGSLSYIVADYVEHLKHHVNQVTGLKLRSAYQP